MNTRAQNLKPTPAADRRESPRMPLGMDVVLNYRAQTQVCTLRDISLRGAFLNADPAFLACNGAVELGITVPQTENGETKHVRVPATIRRLADNGAGVAFGDLAGDTYFSLIDLYTSVLAPR